MNNSPIDNEFLACDSFEDDKKGFVNPGLYVVTIAVVQYPGSSHLNEFRMLEEIPGVRLVWVRNQAALADVKTADCIVLPGSCAINSDLAWLRTLGLDRLVNAHATQGGAVLGICGGSQMLAEALIDLNRIDGNAAGLGLLSVVTRIEQSQTSQPGPVQFNVTIGRWADLSNLKVAAREIHHRQTLPRADMAAAGNGALAVMLEGLAWQNTRGNVLGVSLHGLFKNQDVLQALFLHADRSKPPSRGS